MTVSMPGPLIARGRTAEVYAWQENQILKLFYDWCPQHWAQREADASRIICTKSLPVPELFGIHHIAGRQGILYERISGPSMLTMMNQHPWLSSRYARQMADLHSQIHQANGTGFESLKVSLANTIASVDNLPPEMKASVLSLLESLPEGHAVCHFDFHPGQVLFTANGPILIDWMTAHQGHPLADVARTSILLKVSQVPGANLAMRLIVSLWRGIFYRAYIARYLALHPEVTQQEIHAWMIPVAAARLQEQIPGEGKPLLALIRTYLSQQ